MIPRRVLLRVSAVLVGLAPFVVLECSLRLLAQGDGHTLDPLVGFSAIHRLFEPTQDGQRYETARSRQVFFGKQSFAVEKPAGSYRVFCLGGSTVRGRPYHVETAFPAWLAHELAASAPDRAIEVVNCGGLSYASYRLRLLLQEVLTYEPDLIVIATGHNEFLEDRTYTTQKSRAPLWAWVEDRAAGLETIAWARRAFGRTKQLEKPVLDAEVNARLDAESGYASYHRDDAWKANVLDHFKQSLDAMVRMCREARVPLVLVELGANLRDTVPIKSDPPELEVPTLLRWQQLFELGADPRLPADQALLSLQAAEQLHSDHPLLCFQIARCFEELGQTEAASEYYRKAKELDVCPLRILEEAQAIVRQVAQEGQVPLVDGHTLFAKPENGYAPGYEGYMDHVHPSVVGHQRLGQSLAEALRDEQLFSGTTVSAAARRRLYQQALAELETNYFANGRRRLAWLENWARRERVASARLTPGAQLRRGFRRLQFDEFDAARADISEAVARGPNLAQDVHAFALEQFRWGHNEKAGILVRLLPSLTNDDDLLREAHAAAIVLAVDAEDFERARSLLQASDPFPSDPRSRWQQAFPELVERALAQLREQPSTP